MRRESKQMSGVGVFLEFFHELHVNTKMGDLLAQGTEDQIICEGEREREGSWIFTGNGDDQRRHLSNNDEEIPLGNVEVRGRTAEDKWQQR